MKQNLVSTEQAAEYLGGLKPNTIEGWRVRGEGPRYLKIGRLVRYKIDDLDAYIESRARNATSQAVA